MIDSLAFLSCASLPLRSLLLLLGHGIQQVQLLVHGRCFLVRIIIVIAVTAYNNSCLPCRRGCRRKRRWSRKGRRGRPSGRGR